MFGTLKLPITGLVGNMFFWTCQICGHEHPISTGTDDQWHNLKKLAILPLKRQIWDCSEKGIPCYDTTKDPVMKKSFDQIADALESTHKPF